MREGDGEEAGVGLRDVRRLVGGEGVEEGEAVVEEARPGELELGEAAAGLVGKRGQGAD